MKSNVELAIELLKPKADKYQPVDNAHYLVKISPNGNRDDGDDECCESCIAEMLNKANGDRPLSNGHVWEAKPFDPTFGCNLTSAFLCQYCGEYGDYAVTPDEQEMEHWESLTDDRIVNLSYGESWELCNIFKNTYAGNEDGEFQDEIYPSVEAYAKRIVDVIEK